MYFVCIAGPLGGRGGVGVDIITCVEKETCHQVAFDLMMRFGIIRQRYFIKYFQPCKEPALTFPGDIYHGVCSAVSVLGIVLSDYEETVSFLSVM